MEPNTNKTTAKDFFVYLAIIFSLYTSIGSLLSLLFTYINYTFPDPLSNSQFYGDPYSGAVRFSLAMIIVLFPTLLGFSYYQNKELRLTPNRKDVGIRKWLLLLTLFLAGALIIGDLIALINTFLNGEITMRFLLKVLAILILAGFTLYYYILDLKGAFIENMRLSRLFGLTSIVIVVGSILGGFLIAGSPQSARLVAFDQQKVQDLMYIQEKIISYWQAKSQLPPKLSDLRDTLSYINVSLNDPQTLKPYGYEATGQNSFKLCATFNKASKTYKETNWETQPVSIVGGTIGNWEHPAGVTCYDRIIDPELYKPYQKTTTPLVK